MRSFSTTRQTSCILLVATRSDPPFPLSQLRSRGQLTEVGTADLRFRGGEGTGVPQQRDGAAVGLAMVKCPLLPKGRHAPLYEEVNLCLLTAMSLLALLCLRHPVKLLPVLVFELAWQILWLPMVAPQKAAGGNLGAGDPDVVVNCSLVFVIMAVIPWRYAWRQYVTSPGERWR